MSNQLWKIVDCRNRSHYYETKSGFDRGFKYHINYAKYMSKIFKENRTIKAYKLVCTNSETIWEPINDK